MRPESIQGIEACRATDAAVTKMDLIMQKHFPPPEKFVQIVGWVASVATVLMYFSYIDQIRRNLGGHPGSIVQPAVTICNCALWVTYAAAKRKKDWPIVISNTPGILLGVLALITAL